MTSRHSWANGLTTAATLADYTVALCSHPNDSDSEDLTIRRLLDRGVDGLAIYPVDNGPHRELRLLVESAFPVVTFEGANLLDFICDDVSVDLVSVGRMQARHLLGLGRQRICIANALPAARVNVIRESGIEQELKTAGVALPSYMNIQRPADTEFAEAEIIYKGVLDFVRRHAGEFDAVASYDPLASLVIRALAELGLKIPEEVAVIGSGDEMIASYGLITLTSVNTYTDKAAAQAFALLLERIQGGPPNKKFRRMTSQTELIVRRSTKL